MKKSIIFVLAILILNFNPVFAEGKANTKVGPVKLSANSAKGDNVILSKSGDLMNVAVGGTRLVISRNPSTTNMAISLSFKVQEEDFVAGEIYDLEEIDTLAANAIIVAYYTRGSKGGGVASTAESKVSGKMKVFSYDPATGSIKATINAQVLPVTTSVIKNGANNETAATKPIPIVIKFDGILD